MMKRSEFYGVVADENGELFYATLGELSYLAECNEDFARVEDGKSGG